MNPAGVLLDTGRIVALLSNDDAEHKRAERLFSECAPPLRCCESVLAEACFLMRKVHTNGPAEVIALGRKGVYEISLPLADGWANIEGLLKKVCGSADFLGRCLPYSLRRNLQRRTSPHIRFGFPNIPLGPKQEVQSALGGKGGYAERHRTIGKLAQTAEPQHQPRRNRRSPPEQENWTFI